MKQEKIANKSAREYLRTVRGLLPCSRKVKDEITAPLRRSVAEFLCEQENASTEDLRRRFGAPEVIAASCLEDADTTEILRRLRFKRRVLTIVISTVIVILTSWVLYLKFVTEEVRNEISPTEGAYDVESDLTVIHGTLPSTESTSASQAAK